jgi:hypothetical protein
MAKITKRQNLQNGEIKNFENYGTVQRIAKFRNLQNSKIQNGETYGTQSPPVQFCRYFSHYTTAKNYKTAKTTRGRIT